MPIKFYDRSNDDGVWDDYAMRCDADAAACEEEAQYQREIEKAVKFIIKSGLTPEQYTKFYEELRVKNE